MKWISRIEQLFTLRSHNKLFIFMTAFHAANIKFPHMETNSVIVCIPEGCWLFANGMNGAYIRINL